MLCLVFFKLLKIEQNNKKGFFVKIVKIQKNALLFFFLGAYSVLHGSEKALIIPTDDKDSVITKPDKGKVTLLDVPSDLVSYITCLNVKESNTLKDALDLVKNMRRANKHINESLKNRNNKSEFNPQLEKLLINIAQKDPGATVNLLLFHVADTNKLSPCYENLFKKIDSGTIAQLKKATATQLNNYNNSENKGISGFLNKTFYPQIQEKNDALVFGKFTNLKKYHMDKKFDAKGSLKTAVILGHYDIADFCLKQKGVAPDIDDFENAIIKCNVSMLDLLLKNSNTLTNNEYLDLCTLAILGGVIKNETIYQSESIINLLVKKAYEAVSNIFIFSKWKNILEKLKEQNNQSLLMFLKNLENECTHELKKTIEKINQQIEVSINLNQRCNKTFEEVEKWEKNQKDLYKEIQAVRKKVEIKVKSLKEEIKRLKEENQQLKQNKNN